MKRVAKTSEHVIVMPPVVAVVQVQVALSRVAVQHEDPGVGVGILHECTGHRQRHCPSNTLGAASNSGSIIP